MPDRPVKRSVLGQQHWRAWAREPIVRSMGGLIHPGALGLFERQTCGWFRYLFREIVRDATGRRYEDRFDNLSLFFLNRSTSNAIAMEAGGRRGVGVNIGLPRNIWALMRAAVGHSQFLNTSFKSSAPAPEFDPHAPDAWASLYEDPADHWPQDRYSYLFELFMYAAEFLICHELAHHARGHLDYLKKTIGASSIDEALSLHAAEDSQEGRLLQMLEFDADQHALDLVMLRHTKGGIHKHDRDFVEEDVFKQTLATILTFMAFDLDHRPIERRYTRTHPAPVHRALRLSATILFTYEDFYALPGQQLNQTQNEAWGEAAVVAEILGMPSGRWWGPGDLAAFDKRHRQLSEDYLAFAEELDRIP